MSDTLRDAIEAEIQNNMLVFNGDSSVSAETRAVFWERIAMLGLEALGIAVNRSLMPEFEKAMEDRHFSFDRSPPGRGRIYSSDPTEAAYVGYRLGRESTEVDL